MCSSIQPRIASVLNLKMTTTTTTTTTMTELITLPLVHACGVNIPQATLADHLLRVQTSGFLIVTVCLTNDGMHFDNTFDSSRLFLKLRQYTYVATFATAIVNALQATAGL